jgi:hypothetical protein
MESLEWSRHLEIRLCSTPKYPLGAGSPAENDLYLTVARFIGVLPACILCNGELFQSHDAPRART